MKPKWTFWVFLICSLLIAVGRFAVPGHDLSWPGTYEAFAHIFVGVLLACGVMTESKEDKWFVWSVLAVLTLEEIVMFLLR